MSAQNVYQIGGKTYTRNECEAVYLFWKAKLEEADIREDIGAVLESVVERDDEADMVFARWIKAHMDDCVYAVLGIRRQDEFFQRLMEGNGDGPFSLAATEGCLRDLFAHSERNPA